jgi:hypothetical protein
MGVFLFVGILAGIAALAAGLVVFWVEPLGVLGLLERLTPQLRYRVRTERALMRDGEEKTYEN